MRDEWSIDDRKLYLYTHNFNFRIQRSLPSWFKSEQRLQWHTSVNEMYKLCVENEEYVPTPEFISSASTKGMAELALKYPYRSGIKSKL